MLDLFELNETCPIFESKMREYSKTIIHDELLLHQNVQWLGAVMSC